MRIAILGTRGIPNRYGGFEQFAEYAAPLLAARGHEVYVYNSSLHPYKENKWKNVHLIRQKDPENRLGTIGQFMYDFNCIRDARKRDFDVIFQLGYTSSSLWSFLYPKKSIIITNMDGFEWKRKKYSKIVKWYLKQAERWAVHYSHFLIADSVVMQSYIESKYNRQPVYISYGAIPFDQPNELALQKYGLHKNNYNLVVARLEPENNVEVIIKGHLQANNAHQLIVIGSFNNRHGKYLKKKYECDSIRFYGPLYNMEELNQLRHHSQFYFHGHSVGGTNPSLLEAMASNALIVAHDNVFTRSILGDDAFYFNNSSDISEFLNRHSSKDQHAALISHNVFKITTEHSWHNIAELLEDCVNMTLPAQARKLSGIVNG